MPSKKTKGSPHPQPKSTDKHKGLLSFFTTLKQIGPTKRAVLISRLDKKSIDDLSELVCNILHNTRIPLELRKELKRRLSPHRDCLRQIARKKTSTKNKVRGLERVAGFPLASLLGVGIPLLYQLLRKK